jgi:Cu/Ag efflux protein CusF
VKHLRLTLVALSAAASFAACSKKEATNAEAASPAAPATAAPTSDMAAMPMPADAKMAKGTGTVTAVSADSVTIDHAPIPEANWPAMTMSFRASPELAKSVKVGDKVSFDLKLQGGAGELTAISKQ